jgi:hypothetical protein
MNPDSHPKIARKLVSELYRRMKEDGASALLNGGAVEIGIAP